jgi:hypothetical protein
MLKNWLTLGAFADVFHTLLKEIEKDDGLLVENENGGCVLS